MQAEYNVYEDTGIFVKVCLATGCDHNIIKNSKAVVCHNQIVIVEGAPYASLNCTIEGNIIW